MARPSLEAACWILATITLGTWAIFGAEAAMTGAPNVILLSTALMFTTMTALLPFMSGWRVGKDGLQQARTCRECSAVRWPTEDVFGFCLRCGSTKLAKAAVG